MDVTLLPPRVLEAAEAFEARIAAMPPDQRMEFCNELLAWSQVKIFDLFPE